ncbi:hypothetical protein ABZ851_29945 [Streptomyces sp. NPDC047049]|uniref:hypothetical protein n=1 Tax=Streptomyces sp. NPDC047049 TaxID=3156688 RepID=UPI0034044E5A
MSHQSGNLLFAFIDDRLDERMRADYPDGVAAYQEDWLKAHHLALAHADAVAAGDGERAAQHLGQLQELADGWDDHPDHPVRTAA